MKAARKHTFIFGFLKIYQHLLEELKQVTNTLNTSNLSWLGCFQRAHAGCSQNSDLAHICRPEAVFPLFLNHSTLGLSSRFFLAVPQVTGYSR